ncbi:uncharacterized protein [Asterias amurensis]|uniref:uncharacterized protein n=1 Tax=Asterias amurensis TaxID=7602 RepID=UPI003AB17425
MKKFRQLIRECGEGTVMYNHLHMNLLKAGLVRSRGVGTAGRANGKPRGRGRSRGRGARGARPEVKTTTVNHQQQQEATNGFRGHNEVSALYQQPTNHGPLDLVTRSDPPNARQQIYYDFTSQHETGDANKQHSSGVQNQGIQDSSNYPLNLATPKVSHLTMPQPAVHRNGFAIEEPEPVPHRNRHHSGQTDQRSGYFSSRFFPVPPVSHKFTPNVGVAFVKEIVDCIFPDLAYRPLAAEGQEYLEVTRREGTLYPGIANGEVKIATISPCHPARILVSPEGMVMFQAANRTLGAVEALSAGGDSTVWRKSVLECVQNLTAKSGYRFCPGLGFLNGQSKGSGLSALSSADDIVTSDFGLGFRSVSCDLWYRPMPGNDNNNNTEIAPNDVSMSTLSKHPNNEEGDEDEPLDPTALHVSEQFGACTQCIELGRQLQKDGRRKQRNPRRMEQLSDCPERLDTSYERSLI